MLTLLLASAVAEDVLLDMLAPTPRPNGAPPEPTHAPESNTGCKSERTSTGQELAGFDMRWPAPEDT